MPSIPNPVEKRPETHRNHQLKPVKIPKMKLHKTPIKLIIFVALPLLLLTPTGCQFPPREEKDFLGSLMEDRKKENEERWEKEREERAKLQAKEREEEEATDAKFTAELKGLFNAADYVPFANPGTGSISGQAFVTTKGGAVKAAAGRVVTLIPDTKDGMLWMSIMELKIMSRLAGKLSPSGVVLPEMDSRAAAFKRTTVADADGRFGFAELAPGSYLLGTTISWMVPRRERVGNTYLTFEDHTGIFLFATKPVKNGETATIILRPE